MEISILLEILIYDIAGDVSDAGQGRDARIGVAGGVRKRHRPKRGLLQIRNGKGRKERCLPLWKETAAAAPKWLEQSVSYIGLN